MVSVGGRSRIRARKTIRRFRSNGKLVACPPLHQLCSRLPLCRWEGTIFGEANFYLGLVSKPIPSNYLLQLKPQSCEEPTTGHRPCIQEMGRYSFGFYFLRRHTWPLQTWALLIRDRRLSVGIAAPIKLLGIFFYLLSLKFVPFTIV